MAEALEVTTSLLWRVLKTVLAAGAELTARLCQLSPASMSLRSLVAAAARLTATVGDDWSVLSSELVEPSEGP
jgi:hypothetical protein